MTEPTTLDGATRIPERHSRPANASEFAAMWNAAPETEREARYHSLRRAQDEAMECFIGNHSGELRILRQRIAQEAEFVAKMRRLISSLDTARQDGTIFTYGRVQQLIREALDAIADPPTYLEGPLLVDAWLENHDVDTVAVRDRHGVLYLVSSGEDGAFYVGIPQGEDETDPTAVDRNTALLLNAPNGKYGPQYPLEVIHTGRGAHGINYDRKA